MTRLRLIDALITGIVIVGLLLFGIGQCDKKNDYADRAQSSETSAHKLEEKITALQAIWQDSIQRITAASKERALKDSIALRALESRRTVYVTRAEKLRPEIQAIADSVPVLREFIAAQDSTISVQSKIIATSEHAFQAQLNSLEKILLLKDQQLAAEGQKSEAWRESSVAAEKKAGKQEKKKRGWRTTALVLAGIVGFLAVTGK